jgi:hypothetical protein
VKKLDSRHQDVGNYGTRNHRLGGKGPKCEAHDVSSVQFATVDAAGDVIDIIGSSVRSVIPGLAQKLMGASGDLLLPAIYAMARCFERDFKDMEKLVSKAFSLAKRGAGSSQEEIQINAVKLFRCLVGSPDARIAR